jgi:hypothetical protein
LQSTFKSKYNELGSTEEVIVITLSRVLGQITGKCYVWGNDATRSAHKGVNGRRRGVDDATDKKLEFLMDTESAMSCNVPEFSDHLQVSLASGNILNSFQTFIGFALNHGCEHVHGAAARIFDR